MAFQIAARKPGGPEVLHAIETPTAKPGEGEVRIRHTAIGVNFLDIYFRTAQYPWPVENDLVLGSEAVGIVEEIGPNVSSAKLGDRVGYTVLNGTYASERIIEARHLIVLHDDIEDEVAAASILKGITAHYLLHRSFKVETGQSVLFHAAAGGVGLIACQWLADKGVKVIGTAGGPEKCALALEHGCSEVIDYKNEDFVERVKDITHGEGVSAVYDSVGKDTYPGSLNCLKTFGTLVNFGQSSGPALDFKLSDLSAGSFFVTRPILFHFTENREYLEEASKELFKLIVNGTININVNQRFALAEAAEAHRVLEARKTTGSTVLIPQYPTPRSAPVHRHHASSQR